MTVFRKTQRYIRCQSVKGIRENSTVGVQTIWGGVAPHPWPTSAPAIFLCRSMSGVNSQGGSGARTVYVEMLDDNWKHASHVVNMNGTTSVNIPGLNRRILEARVDTAGSAGGVQNEPIQIEAEGSIIGYIPVGKTLDGTCQWTFGPSQYRWGVIGWQCGIMTPGQAGEVTFHLQARHVTKPDSVWQDLESSITLDQNMRHYTDQVAPYTAENPDEVYDFRVIADSTVSGLSLMAEMVVVHDEGSIPRYSEMFDNDR